MRQTIVQCLVVVIGLGLAPMCGYASPDKTGDTRSPMVVDAAPEGIKKPSNSVGQSLEVVSQSMFKAAGEAAASKAASYLIR